MSRTLAVIGAGAKGVAVAAKAAELRDMGVDVPDVVAIERTPAGDGPTASTGSAPARRRTSASRTGLHWCRAATPNSTPG
jgi:mycobactin lysine-N-oxygenase